MEQAWTERYVISDHDVESPHQTSMFTIAAGGYSFMQDPPCPPQIAPESSQYLMSHMPASSMFTAPGCYYTEFPASLHQAGVAPSTDQHFAASSCAYQQPNDSQYHGNYQYMTPQLYSNTVDQQMEMSVNSRGISTNTPTNSKSPTTLASADDRTKQFTWGYLEFKQLLQDQNVESRSTWLGRGCRSCAKKMWNVPRGCEDLDHQVQYQAIGDVVKEWLKDVQFWKEVPLRISAFEVGCWGSNMPCSEQERKARQATYTLTSSQNFTRDETALIRSLKRHNAQSRQATYHDQAVICRSCAKKKWDSQGKGCTDKDHLAHHKAAVAVIAEWLEKSQRWEKMPKILNAYHIWHWFHDMECVESKQRFDQNAHTKRLRRVREQEQRDQDRTAPLRRILPKPGPNAII